MHKLFKNRINIYITLGVGCLAILTVFLVHAFFNHKTVSEDIRAKMSKRQSGKFLSEETKVKISESSKGRLHSEDSKAKISKSHKGKTKTN